MNTVDVKEIQNTATITLVPVETIQYGFMGLQTYEGVEPIDKD